MPAALRLRKPRPLIARANPQLQAEHKKIQNLVKEEHVDLWALDEVHFQQHGSRCRMWVPPEVADPVLLHHPTRKGIGYFGTVRLRDGKFVYRREDESFNAQTFFGFLRELRRIALRADRPVIVILDNAKTTMANSTETGARATRKTSAWTSSRLTAGSQPYRASMEADP